MRRESGLVVTVTGGAGAGKSTFSAALAEKMGAEVVAMDDFYRSDAAAPMIRDPQGNDWLDVGDPDAIDWPTLNRAVSERATVGPVVVEGLFAASDRLTVASHRRLGCFIETADDVRLIRRIERKVIGAGIPLEAILWNYRHHRRPAYALHTLPLRERCALVLSGESDVEEQVQRVCRHLAWSAS